MFLEVVLVLGWLLFCVLAAVALGAWYRRQERLDVRSPNLTGAARQEDLSTRVR
ncbi:hypothetical protein [Deinococcus maricopensis]|uniref:Uncharacterized protein n=1 Tax=Deinococcus maricopensis (strain DSM 21211 / LMG 22137 / NRRL B-23946 / LB-34) TaxID=709986 RepID=E8UBM6_DEIML|nr:hypothetical protein [Deinococcus maricopensis]ADV68465.1 hypothetical protein Deima_2836 [Deinococcus maricopensis DSM 21211]